MTEKLEQALCHAFGGLLEDIRCTIPVDGKILGVKDVCRRSHVRTATFGQVKKANTLISPGI